MIDDKYVLRAKIINTGVVGYPISHDGQIMLKLSLCDFHFGNYEGDCAVQDDFDRNGGFSIFLNKETANAYGIAWDGTKECMEKIKESLEGRTFNFSMGLEQLVGAVR